MINDKDIIVKAYKDSTYQFKYFHPDIGILQFTYMGYKKEEAYKKFKRYIEEMEVVHMLQEAKRENERAKQNQFSKDA